jgi:hypothetical protein
MASTIAGFGPETLAGGSAAVGRKVFGSLRKACWQKLVGLPGRSLSVVFHLTGDGGGHAWVPLSPEEVRVATQRLPGSEDVECGGHRSLMKLQVVRHAAHGRSLDRPKPNPAQQGARANVLRRHVSCYCTISEMKQQNPNRDSAQAVPAAESKS